PAFVDRTIADLEPVQDRERIVIRGGGIEIARAGERVLREHRRRGQHEAADQADGKSLHFFLMSTLSRAVALRVTVAACRCSPRSGCLNTISCGPIVTARLPIGVSPTFSPSIQTSAHGMALRAIVPFGNSSLTVETLPAATSTVRVAR